MLSAKTRIRLQQSMLIGSVPEAPAPCVTSDCALLSHSNISESRLKYFYRNFQCSCSHISIQCTPQDHFAIIIMPIISQFHRRQAFQPSCPSGGDFYACQSNTNFVGCCALQACTHGCSDGNLEPASFNPSFEGRFHDQQCPTGSRWYTCASTQPPFMGCCKSNPCNDGCPAGVLTAGFLSSNPEEAADFLPSDSAASSSTPAAPSSSSQTSSSPTAIQSSSAASMNASPSPHVAGKQTSSGTIAGATAGSVAAALVLLGLLILFLRRKSLRSHNHTPVNQSTPRNSSDDPVILADSKNDPKWEPVIANEKPTYGTHPTSTFLLSS